MAQNRDYAGEVCRRLVVNLLSSKKNLRSSSGTGRTVTAINLKRLLLTLAPKELMKISREIKMLNPS
jgi:hypothetical protein